MKKALKLAAALAALYSISAHADVTLTYELAGPEMQAGSRTISVSRFFARIDDPAQPDSYLLYQAGKLFPLYQVDKKARTYSQLTPEVKPTLHTGSQVKAEKAAEKPQAKTAEKADKGAQPATAPTDTAEQKTAAAAEAGAAQDSPVAAAAAKASSKAEASPAPEATTAAPAQAEKAKGEAQASAATAAQPAGEKATETAGKATEKAETSLRLTKKSKKVADIPCRVVEELVDGKPVMTHCMADKARLGITERETRTLSRVFQMARKRDLGLLGTATEDEEFISVASKELQSNKTLELKAVSTKPLQAGYLRIERDFKKVPSKAAAN